MNSATGSCQSMGWNDSVETSNLQRDSPVGRDVCEEQLHEETGSFSRLNGKKPCKILKVEPSPETLPNSPYSGFLMFSSLNLLASGWPIATGSKIKSERSFTCSGQNAMDGSDRHSLPSLQKTHRYIDPVELERSIIDPYDSRNIEENLQGNVDSSQLPNLFNTNNASNANNANNGRVNNHGGGGPQLPPPLQQQIPKKSMLGPPPQMGPPGQDPVTMGPMPTKMSPQHHSPNDMNPSANGSTGRKYQCKMCPQIFGSKADLQLHTQIHMRNAKPYKCSQCSKTFANSSYLSQHTRIHLGIKPYRCEICHRKFTQLSHLQQHIRTHTGDKPYKCRYPNCNKAFSQLSNLQSHSRCHQTDKPYKCNSCYKCFTEEAALLEHIPKHKESKHLKTHICQFCGKSYTQETYLAKHMQKHADRMDKQHGGMMNSLVLGPAAMQQFQPDVLWQKAIHAKVVENVNLDDGGPNSSVAAMAAVVASSQRRGMVDTSLQSHLMDPSRLGQQVDSEQENRMNNNNQNDHNDLMPTSQGMYDSQPTMTMANTSNSNGNNKSSSAFTPIQTGLLPISSGGNNQLNISGSSGGRTYFPYSDSINFKNSHSPEVKTVHAAFPNQLISLRQIRSYASMPGISGVDHPLSLKGKGPN